MRKTSRRLGQHFLSNPEILDSIVEYGELSREDVVLEVGAGRGELTERIAERAGKVIAVEIDQRLVEELRERLRGYSNVEILAGDILKLKPRGFNKVVSNPPYRISLKLMEWLLDSKPDLMVLTLQKEFASKLVAKPGTSKYLYISVLASIFYDVKIAMTIPRSAFRPPPKVNSSLVVMKLKEEIPEISENEKEILKKVFTRRRQTAKRVLRDLAEDLGITLEILEKTGEETLSKRVFQLSADELLQIAKAIRRSEEKPKPK